MSDRISALKMFVAVARRGSFSAVARDLGVSQPNVSRAVAALEAQVGARLLLRTTRTAALTEVGALYLSRVEPLIAALDDADQEARGQSELRGTVRVALTSSIAMREVIPRLPTFAARHPAVRVVLMIGDDRRNLTADGVDVAIRLGPLSDSTLTSRRLGASPLGVYASPTYLASVGKVRTPAQLSRLTAIHHSEGGGGVREFQRGKAISKVRLHSRSVFNNNEACIYATTLGLGFFITSRLAVQAELDSGILIQLLEDWHLSDREMHLILPSGKAATAAARAFADYTIEFLR